MAKNIAYVTVEWGYEDHTIRLTARNWQKVKTGRPLRVRGKGYRCEEGFFWDYWSFNATSAGSLTVEYGEDCGVGFVGDLSDAHIEEEADPAATRPSAVMRDSPPLGLSDVNASAVDEDDFDGEGEAQEDDEKAHEPECPYCSQRGCRKHLLACIDATFADQGEGVFGTGIVGGALYEAVEIGKVLDQLRLCWAILSREGSSPIAPDWLSSVSSLESYFDALSRAPGFDRSSYDDDHDAAYDVAQYMNYQADLARDFVEEILVDCGWSEEASHWETDIPTMSSAMISWWDPDPEKVVSNLRSQLRKLLDDAAEGTAEIAAKVPNAAPPKSKAKSSKRAAPSGATEAPPKVSENTNFELTAADRATRAFVLSELLKFGGCRWDGQPPEAVRYCYEVSARSLPLWARADLYEELLALVQRKQCGSHAILAFAAFEAERTLAARAAIDVCMLMPDSQADATTGMAAIGRMLAEEGTVNRGAVFGGMLCAGDRRAHPWLLATRDGLRKEEVDEFSRVVTGLVSAAAFEFVLAWAEQRDGGYEDQIFGALGAWMVNQKRAMQAPQVMTGSRLIPAGTGSVQAERDLMEMVPLHDFLKSIKPRLLALEAREPEPKCMSMVVAVLGLQ